MADFCQFLGYWLSKNASRDHGIKSEFVLLTKSILLCTIGKRILHWSIFATEYIADNCKFSGYWPLKIGSLNHDVIGEFVSVAKSIVFGTAGKMFYVG